MLIAALFTNSQDMETAWMPIERGMVKEDVKDTYTQWSISHKEEWNNTICSNMDGPKDYYTRQSKSENDEYYMIPFIH